MAEAWRTGQAAWPGLALAYELFAAHAGPHVLALDAEARLRNAGDLYLAAACLAGDARAIRHLLDDVLPDARVAIAAIDNRPELVDEALQRLRASLLVGDGTAPKLAQYAGRGPLRAWVGICATRIALMLRRTQQRQREVGVDDERWPDAIASISTADPELELLKRQYAAAFGSALREAVDALEPRSRTVLRMSFAEGLSIDDIGQTYAVHRATAARWVQRACDQLFERTRDLLVDRLALSQAELDRVAALVRSQLDVSLSQLLPP